MTDDAPNTSGDVPQVGDDIVLADDLTANDVVYFERVAPSRVVVHAMTTDRLDSYTGPLFILVMNEGANSARFRQVTRDDLE